MRALGGGLPAATAVDDVGYAAFQNEVLYTVMLRSNGTQRSDEATYDSYSTAHGGGGVGWFASLSSPSYPSALAILGQGASGGWF